MSDITLVIRTADRSRKAELTLSSEQSISEIIQAAIENWSLPKDTDYTVVNTSTGKQLSQSDSLNKSGVSNGDTLEIQPVLVAGRLI